jgi:hypothetical protein
VVLLVAKILAIAVIVLMCFSLSARTKDSGIAASTGIGFMYGQAVTANDTGLGDVACKELVKADRLASWLGDEFPSEYIDSFEGMPKLRRDCATKH